LEHLTNLKRLDLRWNLIKEKHLAKIGTIEKALVKYCQEKAKKAKDSS
jgi:hypothetical protein